MLIQKSQTFITNQVRDKPGRWTVKGSPPLSLVLLKPVQVQKRKNKAWCGEKLEILRKR